jgi:DNA-binding MarR family transcriptional regulator
VTGPLAEDLVEAVTGIRRVIRRRLLGELTGTPLTGSQVELLRVVEASPGIGVAAAARAMRLAGNSVSALVNQLTEAGYLTRHTDPTDRRAARLHLTRAASRRLAAWRTERVRLAGAGLDALSAADRDAIARALPAMQRLVDRLDVP